MHNTQALEVDIRGETMAAQGNSSNHLHFTVFASAIMTRSETTIINPGNSRDPLEVTLGLLMTYKTSDYFAYEVEGTWHVGIHRYASLVIDSQGKEAYKQVTNGSRVCVPVQNQSLNDIAKAFCLEYSKHGKIFGQVAFNFSAHIAGQFYIPGNWPLLNLMVPSVHVAICSSHITVRGCQGHLLRGVVDAINSQCSSRSFDLIEQRFLSVAVEEDIDDFLQRVRRAVVDIQAAKYTTAIPSRVVSVPNRVDMLATLYHGRRANTPRRAFTFKHGEFQATGFSPELVLSLNAGTVFTKRWQARNPTTKQQEPHSRTTPRKSWSTS